MRRAGGEGRGGRGRWSGCLKGEGRPSLRRATPADAGGALPLWQTPGCTAGGGGRVHRQRETLSTQCTPRVPKGTGGG